MLILGTSLLAASVYQSKQTLCKKCTYSDLFCSAFFSHFPSFGLNTERYRVSVRIRENARKMRTRITPNTDTFYAVWFSNFNSESIVNLSNYCYSFSKRNSINWNNLRFLRKPCKYFLMLLNLDYFRFI